MFFDTAYIVKFYRNEADSSKVRDLVRNAGAVYSSLWAFTEFHSVLHRHVREGILNIKDARTLAREFSTQAEEGIWKLLPVTETALRNTAAALLAAPDTLYLRAGDVVHLQTARDAGEREIWTSDRHMLAAAPHFGLKGRSV